MCGRYYVDDDTAREIEKVVPTVFVGNGEAAVGTEADLSLTFSVGVVTPVCCGG